MNGKIMFPFYAMLTIAATMNTLVFFIPDPLYMKYCYLPVATLYTVAAFYILSIWIYRCDMRNVNRKEIILLTGIIALLYLDVLLQCFVFVFIIDVPPGFHWYFLSEICLALLIYFWVVRSNNEYKNNMLYKEGIDTIVHQKEIEHQKALEEMNMHWKEVGRKMIHLFCLHANQVQVSLKESDTQTLWRMDDLNSLLEAGCTRYELNRKNLLARQADQITDLSALIRNHLMPCELVAWQKGAFIQKSVSNEVYVKMTSDLLEPIVQKLLRYIMVHLQPLSFFQINAVVNGENVLLEVNMTGYHNKGYTRDLFSGSSQIEGSKASSLNEYKTMKELQTMVLAAGGQLKSGKSSAQGVFLSIVLPAANFNKEEGRNSTSSNQTTSEWNNVLNSNERFSTILLIDSDRHWLMFMRNYLSSKFNVYCAYNGVDALSKLNTIPTPDLMVCDMQLEVMNGLQFIQSVAGSKKLSHIPVILLSSQLNSQLGQEALRLGAVDCILKPFYMDELESKITAILAILRKKKKLVLENALRFIEAESVDDPQAIQPGMQLFELRCSKYDLTVREKEIVLHLLNNSTNKTIANYLYISERTVAKHIQNVYSKVQVRNKSELLAAIME